MLVVFMKSPEVPIWRGFFIAFLLFITTFTQSMCFQRLFYITSELVIRMRAALVSAVYRKALTLSSAAQQRSTVGEMVNIMAVDIQRIQDFTFYCWVIWSGPLQVTIGMALLFRTLGPSVFVGLGLMILSILFNGWMATFLRKFTVRHYFLLHLYA